MHTVTAARPLVRAVAALGCGTALIAGLVVAGCAGSSHAAGSVPASAIPRLTGIASRAAKASGDPAPHWVTAVLTTHAKALTSATPGDLIPGADDKAPSAAPPRASGWPGLPASGPHRGRRG